MSEREEHIRCIHRDVADAPRMTWCGLPVNRFDMHFLSVDHAALNGQQQGRLVACCECTDAVVKALRNGQGGSHGSL